MFWIMEPNKKKTTSNHLYSDTLYKLFLCKNAAKNIKQYEPPITKTKLEKPDMRDTAG